MNTLWTWCRLREKFRRLEWGKSTCSKKKSAEILAPVHFGGGGEGVGLSLSLVWRYRRYTHTRILYRYTYTYTRILYRYTRILYTDGGLLKTRCRLTFDGSEVLGTPQEHARNTIFGLLKTRCRWTSRRYRHPSISVVRGWTWSDSRSLLPL
jgi:hypothetical protein